MPKHCGFLKTKEYVVQITDRQNWKVDYEKSTTVLEAYFDTLHRPNLQSYGKLLAKKGYTSAEIEELKKMKKEMGENGLVVSFNRDLYAFNTTKQAYHKIKAIYIYAFHGKGWVTIRWFPTKLTNEVDLSVHQYLMSAALQTTVLTHEPAFNEASLKISQKAYLSQTKKLEEATKSLEEIMEKLTLANQVIDLKENEVAIKNAENREVGTEDLKEKKDEVREEEIEKKLEEANQKMVEIAEKSRALEAKEVALNERETNVKMREDFVTVNENFLKSESDHLMREKHELFVKENSLDGREVTLNEREKKVETREMTLANNEKLQNDQWKELESKRQEATDKISTQNRREVALNEREASIKAGERNLEEKEILLETEKGNLKLSKDALAKKQAEMTRESEFKEAEFKSREEALEVRKTEQAVKVEELENANRKIQFLEEQLRLSRMQILSSQNPNNFSRPPVPSQLNFPPPTSIATPVPNMPMVGHMAPTQTPLAMPIRPQPQRMMGTFPTGMPGNMATGLPMSFPHSAATANPLQFQGFHAQPAPNNNALTQMMIANLCQSGSALGNPPQ